MKSIYLFLILNYLFLSSVSAYNYTCSTTGESNNGNHNLYHSLNYNLSNNSDIYKCKNYWMQGNTINTLAGDDKVYISKNTPDDKLIVNLGDGNDAFYHTFHDTQLMNTLIDGGNGYDKIYLQNLDKEKLFIDGNCNNKCYIKYNGSYNRLLGNITLKNIEEIVFDNKSIKFDISNTGDENNNSSNDTAEDSDTSNNNVNYDKINLSNYKYLIPAYWWSYELNKKLENINNAIVIINPSNGDFSKKENIFIDQINRTHKNNNIAIGYIYTLYGKRSLADVKQRIDSRLRYYSNIGGFFFDEVSSSKNELTYYKEIYNYVKSKNKNLIVVLNPGTTPDENYLKISDNIVLYESYCSRYYSKYKIPSWIKNYPSYNFSYLGLRCSENQYKELSKKYSKYIQYFTDDGNDDNTWDSLSKYLQNINNTEINNYTPYNFSKFHSILDISKLTYPDSHTKVVNYGNFANYKSDFFYADKNGNLYFVLDKKSGNGKIRNELRQGINGKDEGWRIDENKVHHLNTKVKLQKLEKTLEYTFLQIHSEVHPLLRIVIEREKNGKQNHIWAVVRVNTNDSGIRTSRYDLGVVDNYFHSFDIYAGNNNLTIKKDGKTYVNKDISYWPEIKNYFKAGIYDSKDSKGSWTVKIAFSELKYDFSNVDDNQNKNIEKFPNGSTWYWNLSEPLTKKEINLNYDIFDIDLFDNTKETILSLKNKGKKVICYISVGTWEDWREDAKQFPKNTLGKTLGNWPSEKYLDIHNYKKFANIMTNRIKLAKEKGCNAIEIDNIDAYDNDTGFYITKNDTINYFNFLATTAHNLGLAIALKNTPEIVSNVVNTADLVIVESCFKYNECGVYKSFIEKGKAVLGVEYKLSKDKFCSKANDMGYSFAKTTSPVNGSNWDYCFNKNGEIDDNYSFSTKNKFNNFLIYYSYPSRIFEAKDIRYSDKKKEFNEKMKISVKEFSKFNSIVWSSRLPNPEHKDHIFTKELIKILKGNVISYGYIALYQGYKGKATKNIVCRDVNEWINMGVDGIFFDEASFNYYKQSNNNFFDYKQYIKYVYNCAHSKGLKVMFNTGNSKDIIEAIPNLTSNDSFLIEGFRRAEGKHRTDTDRVERNIKMIPYTKAKYACQADGRKGWTQEKINKVASEIKDEMNKYCYLRSVQDDAGHGGEVIYAQDKILNIQDHSSGNTQNGNTSTSNYNQQTGGSSTNNLNQTINNNNVETTNNNKAQNDVESTIDEILSNLDKKDNIWKDKIQNLQFEKLNLYLGKYDRYYKLFEKFFNTKKEKILKNEKYLNKFYYNKLIWFNKDTNKLFNDLINNNFNNIKLYLNRFKKTIKILKKIK